MKNHAIIRLIMIQLSSVSKEYADRILFSDVTFSLDKGDKVGFVGRNGSGKSTLFKIIAGSVSPDTGDMTTPAHYSIGYLEQHIHFTEKTLLAECAKCLKPEDVYNVYKVEAILQGLGFEKEDLDKSPTSFSGGYQIRINLAKLLVQEHDLLLLDEPTNYLDIVSMRWLRRFLNQFPGEFILITHDRDFMKSVTNSTMGIHRGKLVKIKGDFEKYFQKIEEEERVYENTRLNQEKKKKQMEDFVNKFRAKARQASLAQSRQKMLEKMENFEELENIATLDFHFNYQPFQAKTMLTVEELSFGFSEPLFSNLNFSINHGDKIAVVGKNGKGKSTLLNLLTEKYSPQKGNIKKHASCSIGHFGQTNIKLLSDSNTVEEEIYASNDDLSNTKVRSICATMMFSGDDAKKKIEVLSGGEKSRVLLGKIIAEPTNLLLLDEPTNHLDQESVDELIKQMNLFPGAVVVVTHSEYILKNFATKMLVFQNENCFEFLGGYDDFLSKIGWGDETPEQASPGSKTGEKISFKEYKQLRSELIKERAKETKPLEQRIVELESFIESCEKAIDLANNELIVASENEDGEAIERFSKVLHDNESQIENYFEELESQTSLLQTKEKFYQEKLEELELKK